MARLRLLPLLAACSAASAAGASRPAAGPAGASCPAAADEAALLQVQLGLHLQAGPARTAAVARSGRRSSGAAEQRPRPVPQAECYDASNDARFQCASPPVAIPPIIYAKTHKTGTETAVNIINRLGDRRNMVFMVPADGSPGSDLTPNGSYQIQGWIFESWLGWPGPFPGNHSQLFYGVPQHQYNIVDGHSVFNSEAMRAYIAPNPFFMTNIREPGAHAVSSYNYAPGNPWWNANRSRTWDEHLALIQTTQPSLYSIWAGRFVNAQAHDLGWYELVGQTTQQDRNATRVREWLALLDRHFVDNGHVILTEYYDECLVLLARKLQLSLCEVAYEYHNAGPDGPDALEATEERKEQARALLPVDVELYAHFNRSFQEAWAAADGPELQAELAELRRLNSEIEVACNTTQGPPSEAVCPPEFTCGSLGYARVMQSKRALGCQRRP